MITLDNIEQKGISVLVYLFLFKKIMEGREMYERGFA